MKIMLTCVVPKDNGLRPGPDRAGEDHILTIFVGQQLIWGLHFGRIY